MITFRLLKGTLLVSVTTVKEWAPSFPYTTIIAMAINNSLVQFLLDNSVVIGTPIGTKKEWQ